MFCRTYFYIVQLSVGLLYGAIVDASIHRHFDNGGWLLLPDDSIINEFKKSAVDNGAELVAMRKSFPDFSKVCLHIVTRLLSF